MALPACSLCGDEQPMLIVGDTSTGDQTFVGPQCLPGFMLTAAAQFTTDMPAEWWAAYGEQLDQMNANDRRPDKPPAAGKRRARPAKQPADSAESAASAPVAVALSEGDACPQCGSQAATGTDDKLTCDGCGNVLAVVPAATG